MTIIVETIDGCRCYISEGSAILLPDYQWATYDDVMEWIITKKLHEHGLKGVTPIKANHSSRSNNNGWVARHGLLLAAAL